MEANEEDMRAAKLALARKKLKDHQEKKLVVNNEKIDKVENVIPQEILAQNENNNLDSKYANEVVINPQSSIVTKSEENSYQKVGDKNTDINIAELLISHKRNLEFQVAELETKVNQIKSAYDVEINEHYVTKQQLSYVQNELSHIKENYEAATNNIQQLNKKVEELRVTKTSISDENNNLTEQLELTKTILTSKETENSSLRNHLMQLQNELDVTKLQLQQLNSGSNTCFVKNTSVDNEVLLQKINSLEQQLNLCHKEKDQINVHYENYVGELNGQIKSFMLKNDELMKKVQNLSIRETNLIDQIGDLEIRLQNVQVKNIEPADNAGKDNEINSDVKVPQDKYNETSSERKDSIYPQNKIQEELEDARRKYLELEQLYAKSEQKVMELQEFINSNNTHENISISKLTADIASDKIAAQRATEQNKKLKNSVQELEEAFIKMSQDKLDLTEKLAAEKFLNRELTIKLAEIEERSKDMHTKLMAKDEEMIRLQMTYRNLEKEIAQMLRPEKICENLTQTEPNENNEQETNTIIINSSGSDTCLHDTNKYSKEHVYEKESPSIPQEDAMVKLQERFMKIMGDVADLSDEKHRLEHIILQLQNETDTICEYVALYQQQRSLLKKRDEERSAQIKLFQVECDRLKSQLEELSGILLRFAEDRELATYFLVESRQKDMEKVRSLLQNLRNNTLVDPKNSLELSNIYPCNCCSGNLIDV